MDQQKEIIFYKGLLPILNAKETLFMSVMINYYLKLEVEVWFKITADEMYFNTGLSRAQQVKIKKSLYELRLLETERRGIPPQNWYWINTDTLKQYIPEVL